MTVPSPCNQVCTIDPETGWCMGCKRSLDEIAAWAELDDAARLAVLSRLAARGHVATPADATRGAA